MVHKSVSLGKNCIVSEFASVDENCILGDNCYVGPHSHISKNVILKDNVSIASFCEIYSESIIGENTKIEAHCKIGIDGFGYSQDEKGLSHFTPQIGKVIIEKDSHIFSHSCIDRAAFTQTRLATGTLLGGHSHIAHNLEIGSMAQIGSGFVVAGSTKIGSHCQLGNRVNCNGHIQLGDNFKASSMSVINNSSSVTETQSGHPLSPTKDYDEIKKCLRELPIFLETIIKIEKGSSNV